MADPCVVIISDDEEDKQKATQGEKLEEDVEPSSFHEPPGWLPDGWTMEVYSNEDGTFNRYYTSPVSGYTFTMKSEVEEYLLSGMDQRLLESESCAKEIMFLSKHDWLPKGWVIEIRAGGKNMNSMYKFYVHVRTGVRFLSKEDVLLYVNEMEISPCDTNGECNITMEDNIPANVELNPDGLPIGWVKEVVFSRTDKRLRKDAYFTDPITGQAFRTLKSAVHYVETGEIIKGTCVNQKTSVYDMYSFDKCDNLPESMRRRLPTKWSAGQKQKSLTKPRDLTLKDINGDAGTSTGPNPPNEPGGKRLESKDKDREAVCSKTGASKRKATENNGEN